VTEKSECTLILSPCGFSYFNNLVPTGVITFRRFQLPDMLQPRWSDLTTGLCDLHLTTGKKIEDIDSVLQVNLIISFARYLFFYLLGRFCE
jgi:hypothetical protein